MAEHAADAVPGTISMPDWPRAGGLPSAQAQLRQQPEDFQVDEQLGFAPDGAGEHLLLQVWKKNLNTDQVARQLARHAGVAARDVSYGGLKDRNAVTTQWFSLWLPGKPDPDWQGLESASLRILSSVRHRRKLPRGALKSNRFVIVLREMQGPAEVIEQRLTAIRQTGVPNYFGEQRFGRDGQNVQQALAMFAGRKVKDRHLRGIYLSAARSCLFNQVLAARVVDGNWNRILPGEAVMLCGSRSFFIAETVDEVIATRLAERDIAASGPLWGRGELPCSGEVRALELATVSGYRQLCQGLEDAGLEQERRALRLDVNDLQWHWLDDSRALRLHFELPAGAYATAVLREVVAYREPQGWVAE